MNENTQTYISFSKDQFEYKQEKSITKSSSDINPAPWMSENTAGIVSSLLRMHNQSIDYTLFVVPQAQSQQHENNLKNYQEIKSSIEKSNTFKQAVIIAPFLYPRCYLKSTQLQIYVYIEDLNESTYGEIKHILASLNFDDVEIQEIQEKPIWQKGIIGHKLKFGQQTIETKVIIWVSSNEDFKQYIQQIQKTVSTSAQMKYLYTIIMCMVRQRNFHNFVRSIAVFGLCDTFLYERRKQKTRTLGENILKILEYFGMGTLQQRKIVYIPRTKNKYQVSVDIQGFSLIIGNVNYYGIPYKDLFAVFKNRYRLVSNFSFPVGRSILMYLVNPSSQQFSYV